MVYTSVYGLLLGGGGAVLPPTDPGGVQVLDARTEILLRTLLPGLATTALLADERRTLLYVTEAGAVDAYGVYSGPGTLYVLDARTGAVLCTARVGIAPATLALDRLHNRLFVYNAGGRTYSQTNVRWGWLPSWAARWLSFASSAIAAPTVAPASVTMIDTSHL